MSVKVHLTCTICGAESGPCDTYEIDPYSYPDAPYDGVQFFEPIGWRIAQLQAYCPQHPRMTERYR